MYLRKQRYEAKYKPSWDRTYHPVSRLDYRLRDRWILPLPPRFFAPYAAKSIRTERRLAPRPRLVPDCRGFAVQGVAAIERSVAGSGTATFQDKVCRR